ncbi:hypothetical protein K456DRAFT_936741 [Colletotrichum gloeosporioides 23]|nr:hypothetical protein K456DRAFT_936741 [Colletotrichum gloeosporioides 23]
MRAACQNASSCRGCLGWVGVVVGVRCDETQIRKEAYVSFDGIQSYFEATHTNENIARINELHGWAGSLHSKSVTAHAESLSEQTGLHDGVGRGDFCSQSHGKKKKVTRRK